MIPLLLRFWKPLVAVGCAAIIWFAVHHYGAQRFSAGYQQATSEDAKALADSKLKYDAKVKADEARIAKADRDTELANGQVAALSATAHREQPRLVCKPAPSHRSELPSTADIHAGEAPAAGVLAGADAEGFDPTSALLDYATDVEYLTVSCRQLHQEVHGVPSAP